MENKKTKLVEIYFKTFSSDGTSKVFKLTRHTDITVGRSSKSSEVKIQDENISSKHCRISFDGVAVYIQDLDSKNNSFLNDVAITKQQFYIDDIIKIGSSTIQIYTEKLCDKGVSLLTYKGKRANKHPTLELKIPENFTKKEHSFKKNKLSKTNQKLYSGIGEGQEENTNKSTTYVSKLAHKTIITGVNHLTVTLVFFTMLYSYKLINPKRASVVISSFPNISALVEQSHFLDHLYLTIGVTFIVKVLNKKLKIMEKLLNLSK